jgi:hypothetical protein
VRLAPEAQIAGPTEGAVIERIVRSIRVPAVHAPDVDRVLTATPE